MWAPRPLIGVRTHPGALGLWAQAGGLLIRVRAHWGSGVGPRSLIGVHTHLGALGLRAQAATQLIRVCAHPGFQVWEPSSLIWVRANRASLVCWGCLSQFTVQGMRG